MPPTLPAWLGLQGERRGRGPHWHVWHGGLHTRTVSSRNEQIVGRVRPNQRQALQCSWLNPLGGGLPLKQARAVAGLAVSADTSDAGNSTGTGW